jgi:hypothetical protein
MGSSKELRKYECVIYKRADGSIKMKMVLISEVGDFAVNEIDESQIDSFCSLNEEMTEGELEY